MAQSRPRIVYLAVADARGHLMRASLLRRLLGDDGVRVDVVTTSLEGQQFLAALGCPSERISPHFRVEFGEQHQLLAGATSKRVAKYLALPGRGLSDLLELQRLARGAAFVVNDSLHPALLAAGALGQPFRVVHVAGENLWQAARAHFDGQPAPVREAYRLMLGRAFENAFGCITHSLSPGAVDLAARRWSLPPLVDVPLRAAAQVREALGTPLAAVYLNPHFRDPAIAANVEAAVAARGMALYGVSEAFAARRGWVAHDRRLADVIAAADVFISGAGMGALEQAKAYGTPMVALLGAQPEQERNIAQWPSAHVAVARVGVETGHSLSVALGALPRRTDFAHSHAQVVATHQRWREAFRWLIARSPGGTHGRNRRRLRNEQPLESRQ